MFGFWNLVGDVHDAPKRKGENGLVKAWEAKMVLYWQAPAGPGKTAVRWKK